MGIFDALTTSVGGLQAQSFALQNISGNIANSSTTGYKGIGTTFEDLIPQTSTPDRQVAGGVTAFAQATITTQGTVSATTVATNMAINGQGFFNVQKPIGIVDNLPVFDGTTDYTRRGDFQLNATGNLVNGAGYYLIGVTVDPKTGNPTGNVPKVLQFQNNFIPAQATTEITYAANLPTTPSTGAASGAVAGSLVALGGLNPNDFSVNHNPVVLGTPAPPFTDATTTGSAVSNKAAVPAPITGATLLSGAANTDSITTNFAAGDTITVNGTPITFVAAGAVGNQLNVTDSVSTMLAKIDSITGTANPSTVAANGAITLHTGVTSNLTVTSSNAAAFAALGFGATATATRGGGGTPGTGVVIGNDTGVFTTKSISGGAVTAYDATGTPVNLQLRWAKVDSAALGSPHTDTWNLFYEANPNATGAQAAWVNAGTNFVFGANGAHHQSLRLDHLAHQRCGRQPVGRQPHVQFRLRRPDPICLDRRHRDHQRDLAKRLRRRPAAIGRHQQQRPRGRNVLQRPEPRSRLGLAVAFQRHQLPARRSMAAPMPRPTSRASRSRARPERSAVRRWKVPIPTSPMNSPS